MTISLKRTILLLLPIAFHSVFALPQAGTPPQTSVCVEECKLWTDIATQAPSQLCTQAALDDYQACFGCMITQPGETQFAVQSVIDGIVQSCNAEGHPINGITVTPITPTNAPETATSAATGPSDSASGPSPTGGAGLSTASAADSASTSSATGAPSGGASGQSPIGGAGSSTASATDSASTSSAAGAPPGGTSGPSTTGGAGSPAASAANSASTSATGVPSGSASGPSTTVTAGSSQAGGARRSASTAVHDLRLLLDSLSNCGIDENHTRHWKATHPSRHTTYRREPGTFGCCMCRFAWRTRQHAKDLMGGDAAPAITRLPRHSAGRHDHGSAEYEKGSRQAGTARDCQLG
ncbi:hypothetical protein B0H14DRAFT_2606533 [Mycena olivaceomarginata]|nr:hypothetical protein B0H14DRAFT_2606533 [Mycena olivaceomarginata]